MTCKHLKISCCTIKYFIFCLSSSVPSIEDILKSKLSEADMTAEKDLQKHPRAKEFVKQVWNIHHSGQPLPTEQSEPEDSDIMIAQVGVLRF